MLSHLFVQISAQCNNAHRSGSWFNHLWLCCWTTNSWTIVFLTGCWKKGARLELSLVHQHFNLGNDKNIKWIPVFLCYNRSTTEWKRRESETKPITSEREKWEGRREYKQMGREMARGRANKREGPLPVRSDEGSQENGGVWSSCQVKDGRPQWSLVGNQARLYSPQKIVPPVPSNPLPQAPSLSTASRETVLTGTSVSRHREQRKLSKWIQRTCSTSLLEACIRKAVKRHIWCHGDRKSSL